MTAAVFLLAASIAAPLTGADVRRVLKAHKTEVQECYDGWLRGLDKSPGERTVKVSFEVLRTGRPQSVELSEWSDTPFGECVRAKVRRWRFPRHDGPDPAAVVLPFRLLPKGPAAAP